MSTAHTPTPWEFQVVSGDVRHHLVPGDGQKLNTSASWIVGPVARSRYQAEKDRDFADRAVNAHDDLLAACKAMMTELDIFVDPYTAQVVKQARAAIAKAEGQ